MGRKGWGAYSIDALAEGTFVADYTGEALPVEEARKRVPTYDQDGLNYVLTTQEFFQQVYMRNCAVCGCYFCTINRVFLTAVWFFGLSLCVFARSVVVLPPLAISMYPPTGRVAV